MTILSITVEAEGQSRSFDDAQVLAIDNPIETTQRSPGSGSSFERAP